MSRAFNRVAASLSPVLRVCLILGLFVGLGAVLGRVPHRVDAAGPGDDDLLYVSGVVSTGIDCLSVGGSPRPVDNETHPSAGACPSEAVVALRWEGEPGRARLVLTTSGAGAAHSVLVNGKLAAKAPLAADRPPAAGSLERISDDAGFVGTSGPAQVYYLTIPAERVVQGENRIEIAADKAADALADQGWLVTDVRLELYGRAGSRGLRSLPLDVDPGMMVRTGDISLSAVRSIIGFTNLYDGSYQEAVIQAPDGYRDDQATPLLIYAHGRGGTMSTGIDQFGEATNDRGWLLASPEMHGHWDVPEECFVYPNDCTWDDKILAGTDVEDGEPRPGAYAYASLESQHDLVGTVRYMIEHYNVKLDQIFRFFVTKF